ncbi:MAG: OmpA family protein [bacterium]
MSPPTARRPCGFGADRPLADTRNPRTSRRTCDGADRIERWWTTAPCPAGTTEPPATTASRRMASTSSRRGRRASSTTAAPCSRRASSTWTPRRRSCSPPRFLARVEVVAYEVEPEDDARAARLSDRRARAVRDYLLQRGVPADRIDARGMPPSADATWLFIRRWGL